MERLLKCHPCDQSFKIDVGDVEVCPHCLRLMPSAIKALRCPLVVQLSVRIGSYPQAATTIMEGRVWGYHCADVL